METTAQQGVRTMDSAFHELLAVDTNAANIMECMFLAPMPESGEFTPVSEIHWLGADEDWTEAPELGMLARIFNQDLRNLAFVFEGLKATAREHIRLSDYNELKLRHFHQLYGEKVGRVENTAG
jgi:hypothetical protein